MIYLDWSATSPLCESAKKVVIDNLDTFGNPSSLYDCGKKSKELIEETRNFVAKSINADPEEIFFTSGSSESNTWAINSKKYISSNIEHHSIPLSHSFKINKDGIIDISQLKKSLWIKKFFTNAKLFTCMYVNNEIGTIQPIDKISKICHENNLNFHVDATQAVPHMSVDVREINCESMSFSGHKFGGLKGTGVLYIKKNYELHNLIYGGKQEQGRRPGTENILGILSLGAALNETINHMVNVEYHVAMLKSRFVDNIKNVYGVHFNVNNCYQLNSVLSIRFDDVPSNLLVSFCNRYGIYISSGSACNEGTLEPSHVLTAIGLSNKEALETIRVSFGSSNTIEEIDYACKIIKKLVKEIRNNN